MPDINKHEVEIIDLKNQNIQDFEKDKIQAKQIENINNEISNLKKREQFTIKKFENDYKKLRRIIIDENISVTLDNKIDANKTEVNNRITEINEQLTTNNNAINNINEQLEHITTRIDGLELGGNLVLRDVVDGEIFTLDSNTTPIITYGNIVVSKTSTTIIEGSTDSFTIKLDKAPTNNQVVTLSKNNSDVTLDKTSLTFTPSNYDIAKTVNISVAEDADYSNETCTITLSSPNVTSKTILVSITDNDEEPSNIPVQSVSLPSTHTLKVDETIQLTPVITPSNATNQSVNWSTNNGNCTVVGGLVTAIAEGECIITCTTVDQNKTAECTITVESETETIAFTNLLINSDTFEAPSGFPNYWQTYKGTKTVEKNGTCKYTCTDTSTSPLAGLFKCDLSYHTTSNGLIEGHKYYYKHKHSDDGINYTLSSNITTCTSTGLPSGTLLFNYLNLNTIVNKWVKDCIMIDLTEMYGSGNEPSKTECDNTFGDLWHA